MNIDEIIKASGVPKVRIARRLGVSPQHLCHALKGRRPVPLKWVIPICDAIGCDPNTLLGWTYHIHKQAPTGQAMHCCKQKEQ